MCASCYHPRCVTGRPLAAMTDPSSPPPSHSSSARCFRLLLLALLLAAVTLALSFELLWRRPYFSTTALAPLLLSSPNHAGLHTIASASSADKAVAAEETAAVATG